MAACAHQSETAENKASSAAEKREEPKGEVVLLIDTREVKTKKDRSYLYQQLLSNKVVCEKRALPLGDVLWIYREFDVSGGKKKPKEYVMNYIMERKRADDLASSIMDGRYIEQKHRLLSCGITNVVYIVEGEPSSQCRVSDSALRTAVIHTKVVSGFKVFRAKSVEVPPRCATGIGHDKVAEHVDGEDKTEPGRED